MCVVLDDIAVLEVLADICENKESIASIVTENGTLEASVKSVFQSSRRQKSATASIIWEKIESVRSAFAATGNSGACGRKEKKHKS